MHAPPPYQLTLRRYGVWRTGCGMLVAVSGTSLVAWAPSAYTVHAGALALSLLVWAAASTALLVHAWRMGPLSLRWDGQTWRCGPASAVGAEPLPGDLAVALDLGDWMLLRFSLGRHRAWWLPVQRRGHELAWQGLRATVYCARPVALPTAAPF